VRGEEIVSITVIQGPQQDRSERERILKLTSGEGVVRPVMRGSVVRKSLIVYMIVIVKEEARGRKVRKDLENRKEEWRRMLDR